MTNNRLLPMIKFVANTSVSKIGIGRKEKHKDVYLKKKISGTILRTGLRNTLLSAGLCGALFTGRNFQLEPTHPNV